MINNVFKIFAVFIVGTVGGIFADQILWPYFVEKPLFSEYRLEQRPIYVTEQVFIQENDSLQNSIEKVNRAIVGIRTETKTKKILEGSGLIVTSDGLVVTSADLLPKDSRTTLFFDGKIAAPKIIQVRENLALLRIEGESLSTVGFGDFNKLKLGQRVFLMGIIFSESAPYKKVNEGIIKYFDQNSLIHTNIFEKEGSKGSVLFDNQGNILGLNVFNEEGEVVIIPIFKIKEFLGF